MESNADEKKLSFKSLQCRKKKRFELSLNKREYLRDVDEVMHFRPITAAHRALNQVNYQG